MAIYTHSVDARKLLASSQWDDEDEGHAQFDAAQELQKRPLGLEFRLLFF